MPFERVASLQRRNYQLDDMINKTMNRLKFTIVQNRFYVYQYNKKKYFIPKLSFLILYKFIEMNNYLNHKISVSVSYNS